MGQNRILFFSACGLAGIGALIGGLTYLTRKIERTLMLHNIRIEQLEKVIVELREDVELLIRLTRSSITRTAASSICTTKSTYDNRSSEEEDYLTADEDDLQEQIIVPTQHNTCGDEQLEQAFLNDIDTLLDGNVTQQEKAYFKLQENTNRYKHLHDFWWRFARGAYYVSIADSEGGRELKKKRLQEAQGYAQKAVEINDGSSSAHKWLAIVIGARSEFLGINEKIQYGYKFKEHVDRAIFLDPTDSTSYYLLGRFSLEVSMLSWIERQVAATLFSAPPSSTPEEALGYFLQSENLKPFMDNRFYLAKCYLTLGNKCEARKWVDLAASMPATTATELASLQNIRAMQKQLDNILVTS